MQMVRASKAPEMFRRAPAQAARRAVGAATEDPAPTASTRVRKN